MNNSKKPFEVFDNSLYTLAKEVTAEIAVYKDDSTQQQQVEELLAAEKDFKEAIVKYRQANEVYKKFLQKVYVQNKHILSARPYFRESAITFSAKISPAIKGAVKNEIGMTAESKKASLETLKTFNINYQLIKFIRDSWLGPFPKKAEQLFQRVHTARNKLIILNSPLAINRAKLFYRKTPKSHLNLMDMIGICFMGLAAGIDKWCGPYSTVFRSVCIGRMVGNLIDAYSETMIHFYPSDRRILYKANSIRGRQGIDNVEDLTTAVNKSFTQDKVDGKNVPFGDVDIGDLNALMQAASVVSADATVDEEGMGVYQFTMDSNQNIEENLIEKEQLSELFLAAKKLPIIYRKVLRLKGIVI